MIEGVKVTPVEFHSDDRGWLAEVCHCYELEQEVCSHEAFDKDVKCPRFGQVYAVGNYAAGTIRAFHKHAKLWDYFFIVNGAAKFVLVDDRDARILPNRSPEGTSMQSEILSARRPALITIPPGVFHGWMSLEPNTILISVGSELYDREHPDETRIDAYSFGDIWSVKPR